MKKSPILLLSDASQDRPVIYAAAPLAISNAPVSEWEEVEVRPIAVLSSPDTSPSWLAAQLRIIADRLDVRAAKLHNLAI